jgi:hypothetical protein
MQQTFLFDTVAVIVGPWRTTMERGARVEVRRLADEAQRGSRAAAQRIVIDQPIFRADLFDRVDAPAGNLGRAHFHPRFNGVEPCERTWSESLQRDPTGWLAAELGDLDGLLAHAGIDRTDARRVDDDAVALRRAMPLVLAAVEAAWDEVRSGDLAERVFEFLGAVRQPRPPFVTQ